MSSVVVVGAQWGDEAKGKVVDLLAQQADVVVRYAGGSNAGHTVMVEDVVLKLHLTPSGILNPHTYCIISSGVVVDPSVLCTEIEELHQQQISTAKLVISGNAHVVLPYHRELDRLEEERKGTGKIGTTMQGVGPAYADKARRCGIRMGELVDRKVLRKRIDAVLADKNFLIEKLYGGQPLDGDVIFEEYAAYGDTLRPFVNDAGRIVSQAAQDGKRIIFEGAQGTMLDIDYGTYPFVTSSHPVAGGACLGTGVGPHALGVILGVAKSYTTRVGAGAFPTEQENRLGELIRERGQEYGTTTGRARRVGWLDMVALRYAVRVNGMDALALTLLDVLSTVPDLKVCVAYRCNGQRLTELPADPEVFEQVEPEYEEFAGWDQEISDIRDFDALPANAQRYVRRVEELCGVPIAIVSIGKRRSETLIRRPELIGLA